ncbi:MAG: DNA mismatch repair protein MutL, partial [Bacteroidetes bacterium]
VKHSLGQFSIAPILDFNKDGDVDTPYEYSKKSPVNPSIEVDRSFNPFEEDSRSGRGNAHIAIQKQKSSSWESLYIGLQESGQSQGTSSILGLSSFEVELESEEITGRLFSDKGISTKEVTFQIQNKYIVCAIKSGMMVIHQNLAHQRVLYEELLKNMTVQEAVSQQLLFPLHFQFSKPKVELLKTIKEQLEYTGFVFSALENEKVAISGVPAGVLESSVEGILEQLLSDIENEVPDAGFSQNDVLAKSLAKSLAIKSGVFMEAEAQEHLIHQLFACKEPSVSPDNRPVLATLEVSDLDKKFI